MKRFLFLNFILLTFTISCFAQPAPTFSNIDYVGNSNIRQKLDIYIPAGLTATAPVVVFIHGGGWVSGSKGAGNVPYFEPCFNVGFICVDVNYRLSGDSAWPAQIEDCKTAIRYLRANATTYGIDTNRIGVMGGSAGGHLSAIVGTTAGVNALEGFHQGYTNVSSRVKAVADLYGPTDFLFMDGYYTNCTAGALKHEYNSFETNLLNIDSLHKPIHFARVQSANPIAYLTPDDAHFFIIHGGSDCSVPTYQSKRLDSMLTVKGIPADTFIIANGIDHGGPFFQGPARTLLYKNFFVKWLGSATVLPLTLLDFTATQKNTDVNFNWKTSNEINTNYFSIEKSTDAISFNTIGKVLAYTNSTNENNYNFKELNIQQGKYYYRLKIIDNDGKFSYSPIISILVNKKDGLLVFPTITTDNITILNTNANAIYLYSASGQMIKQLHPNNNSIADIADGFYFIKVNNEVVRIVKQ
jgi:acetyl esterase/lipase